MILSNERNTFQYPILSILELKMMHSHKKKTTFHFSPFFPIKLEKQTSSSKITLPLDDDPKFHLEEERDWPRSSSKHVRANLILSVVATEKKEKKKKVLGGRRLSSRLGNYSFSRRRGGFRIQRRPPSLFVYSTVSVVGRLGQRQTARYCFINPAPCKKEAVHHPSVAGCTVYRCAPIIVSRSRRFIAAQFIREFASRWMNGVAA